MKRSLLLIATGILFIFLFFLAACGGKEGATPQPEATPSGTLPSGAAALPADDGAEMLAVPAGSFTMGSSSGAADEAPHPVTLAAFRIYKTEVTNGMYAQCVAAGQCFPVAAVPGTPTENSKDAAYADRPVVGADYNMAAAYCAWAGGRLPTEAEWEYAASGGQAQLYPWGDAPADCEKANFLGCLDPAEPVAVGAFPQGASPLRILDMAGNAWEWVFDWYAADAGDALDAHSALAGPLSGQMKVVRGGGYDSDLHLLTVSNRHAGNPYFAYSNVGFRCVLSDSPLELPSGYALTDPSLHSIPTDEAPVDLVDPGGTLGGPGDPGIPGAGSISVSMTTRLECPDVNGELHAVGSVTSTADITGISFSMNGIPYACDPLAAGGAADCHGAVPPEDALPGYTGEMCVSLAGKATPRCFDLGFTKPAACEISGLAPTDFKAFDSCGSSGSMYVQLVYKPSIYWSTIEAAGTPLVCDLLTPGVMHCLVTGITHDQSYTFTLRGTYNGQDYSWSPTVFLKTHCSDPDGAGFSQAFFMCAGVGQPELYVQHEKAADGSGGVLEDVVLGGTPLTCTDDSESMAVCAVDPALAGTAQALTVCVDSACRDESIPVPTCPASAGVDFKSALSCDPTAAVSYTFSTAAQPAVPLESVLLDGSALNCDQVIPGYMQCRGLEGLPGTTAFLTVCSAAGDCYDLPQVFPDCGAASGTPLQIAAQFTCTPEGRQLQIIFLPAVPPQVVQVYGDSLKYNDCEQVPGTEIYTCRSLPETDSSSVQVQVIYVMENGLQNLALQIIPNSDCSQQDEFSIAKSVICQPDGSGLYTFMGAFSPHVPITGATLNGAPLACNTSFPGSFICPDLTGTPGEMAVLTLTTAEFGTLSYNKVFPSCADVPAGTGAGVKMEFLCEPTAGSGMRFVFTPDLPAEVVSFNANGVELNCTREGGSAAYHCTNLPGQQGDLLKIIITYATGAQQVLYTTHGMCQYDGGYGIFSDLQCEPGRTDEFHLHAQTMPLLVITELQVNGVTPAECVFNGNEADCRHIPIVPGEEKFDYHICLDNGWCPDKPSSYPDCPVDENSCDWLAMRGSCEDGRMQFRLLLPCDTGTRLVSDSISASDGSQEYECIRFTPNGGSGGGATCFGFRPTTVPFDLTITYRLSDDPSRLRFATIDRDTWAATLPYCETAQATSVPGGSNPPPPTAVVNCSAYTWNNCPVPPCYVRRPTSGGSLACFSTP